MPHHLKPLYFVRFIRTNTALLSRNINLLHHRVHTVKIGQQQTAPRTAGNDHTVTLWIELFKRIHGLGLTQHVYTVFQFIQFLRMHWRESGTIAGMTVFPCAQMMSTQG